MDSKLDGQSRHRDPDRTPDPTAPEQQGRGHALTFAVQKHEAHRLHYDLRLEVGGTLKSWAIPKGFSLDPGEKRLAVMVEDQPIDRASFEGTIPEGDEGAGAVIVWDSGIYTPDDGGQVQFDDRDEAEARVGRGLAEGRLSLFLWGTKLAGSWELVRPHRNTSRWVLIKRRDEFADLDRYLEVQDRSVLSGLTLEDVQAGVRPEPVHGRSTTERHGAEPSPFPESLVPMLATPADGPLSHPDWLFEPMLEGVRSLAFVRDGQARLLTGGGLDVTPQYPEIARLLARQPQEMVLDGEIVVLDEEGRPSPRRLRQPGSLGEGARGGGLEVVYYAFDLLHLDGYDLRDMPLEQRKAILATSLLPQDRVRVLDHLYEDGETAFEAAVAQGMEGIVAKRRDSSYEPGRRSPEWRRVEAAMSAGFVIGGFTERFGARPGALGSLLLGSWEDGRLIYAGHASPGLDRHGAAGLRRRLEQLRTEKCPFSVPPPMEGFTTWVRPELVGEVRFAQWTEDSRPRAAVLVGLREVRAAAKPTERRNRKPAA